MSHLSDDDDDEDIKAAMALSLQQSPTLPHHTRSENNTVDLTSETDDEGEDQDEDEDEELRRAMALSLEQVNDPPSDDAHDADLRRAIALSLGEANAVTEVITTPPRPIRNLSTRISSTQPTMPSVLGQMDRKAMEEERLTRLAKRKREPTPETSSKRAMSTETVATQAKPSQIGSASTSASIVYPQGVIKRTFAKGYPRTNDITIEKVFEASKVTTAVISSFMWESEWMWEKLNPAKIKQIWVMSVKDKETQDRYIQDMKETGVPNLEIHYPPMHGSIHCAHAKYMLLFGKDKLRIVIPTANMTPVDWGEVENKWQAGVMENSVFLIDLPRRTSDQYGETSNLTQFGRDLVYFLEQQKLEQKVIDAVLRFDFAQTSRIGFVQSIGGIHKNASHATGLSSLATVIQTLKLDNPESVELDYAASSLGAINDSLLSRLHIAAQGRLFTAETELEHARDHFRIYFPTDEQVEKSMGGPDCGGIISLSRASYNSGAFPKECMRNYDSNRRGMLSHNKLLFARGRKKDGNPIAWVYVGSSNISEAAWGSQKVLNSGSVSMTIKNWECGVIMPVAESDLKKLALSPGEIPPMSVFEGTIEVPFVFPGENYAGRKPWFYKGP